jgi:hypothetical protein
MGDRGRRIVLENSGAVQRHLQVAAELLDAEIPAGSP